MEYSVRQRMALLIEANTTAEKITAMRDAEIDHAFLLQHHVSPTLLRAAKITPLHRRSSSSSRLASPTSSRSISSKTRSVSRHAARSA